MSLRALGVTVTLARLVVAHRMCTTCIPLEDLLMPGYGISLTAESLSSAAAYHNGTTTVFETISGSEEYRTLMASILIQGYTEQPRYTATRCPARHRLTPVAEEHPKPPWDYAFDILKVAFTSPAQESFESQPRLGPSAEMLKAQLLALEPFASMSPEQLAKAAVAVQIPSWLISSPYACDLREATEATFGRAVGLESPASSAYTVLGYELCRVAQDMYECSGPGRLAVFEYDARFATASVTKTPVDFLSRLNSQYSLIESTDFVELANWMRTFIEATSPDMLTLTGTEVEHSIFQSALVLSDIIDHVQTLPTIKTEDTLVVGAAQVAKDELENHGSDCGEFDECLDIRAQADELAGRYTYPRPRIWPAANSRHWRSWTKSTPPSMMSSPKLQLPLFDRDGLVADLL